MAAAEESGKFCARQPGVCLTADYIAARLEAKAKYGASLIYNWAAEASHIDPFSSPAGKSADTVARNGFSFAALEVTTAPQNTLTIEDLIPEWRKPAGPSQS